MPSAPAPPRTDLPTHEVTNQPPDAGDRDLYRTDAALHDAVRREAGDWLDAACAALGPVAGSAAVQALGEDANRHPPELRVFDRHGRRLDEVAFHPAYHRLMALAMQHRIHDIAWTAPGPAPHAGHAALLALFTQAEPGVMCPVDMTHAAVPVLSRHAPDWAARIVGGRYDAALAPPLAKAGLTVGMAMTEKQGGSDLRANATRAEPVADGHVLTGHKWFCSAPMSDGFLTLAQLPDGLTCFLVPRVLPDGRRNAIQLMRLKDKLGNRANASAEIEYHGALAQRIGAPGRGIATIIEMVHHTRLGTTAATLGIMRAALAEAARHCRHRRAFQRRLIDQPLMRAVLAELQVEYEAAAALVLHVAARFSDGAPEAAAYARLAVALAKFRLTRRCPGFVAECLECLGGGGYVEENPLPRLYREAPLNGIWEGSGNVIALDIRRTLDRAPAAAAVLLAELEAADPVLAAAARATLDQAAEEAAGRAVAERLALLLQAALLTRHAPAPVADAFRARISAPAQAYGTVPAAAAAAILPRLDPEAT